MKIRETIERSLTDEPQSVVRVHEKAKLKTDIQEYVVTDQLAREFTKVLQPVVDSARPGGGETDKIGIWISGFFGSGKSHFAKLAGHLLADTPLNGESARSLFKAHLHHDSDSDQRMAEVLQQATNYRLRCHLVGFDITALNTPADQHVGITFLRAFNDSLGLSGIAAFAEREIELQEAGLYDKFLSMFHEKGGGDWLAEKDVHISSPVLAECLAELLPGKYRTQEIAHQSLQLAVDDLQSLTIDGVVDRLLRWLDGQQRLAAGEPKRIVFVADEVGGWCGGDLKRIEQVRAFVETLATKGNGRIWLIVTSQEKLSNVVLNADSYDVGQKQEFLQRLEARFRINGHLESSEVGKVIEERILRKRPTAEPYLKSVWSKHQEQIRDIAEPPGLELMASYPAAEQAAFVRDYPFLPYQITAAADIFGGMRGVRISSGARSMIGIVFDSVRKLAEEDLGSVVSWDQIFDSANRENEFADEQYLGSHGLEYLASADRDVKDVPLRPTRVLKALWLVQQGSRIPRTPENLARLLVDRLDLDILKLEGEVRRTLEELARFSFVRQEAGTEQWRVLTQDEVTVEKIVQRIIKEDVRQRDVANEIFELYKKQLQSQFNGNITVGKSATSFQYGVYLEETPLRNEGAPVRLSLALATNQTARKISEQSASYLNDPTVYWIVEVSNRLDERLRRAIAIRRLPSDEEYQRVATDRTRREAEKLELEADRLLREASEDVDRAFESGTLHWAGKSLELIGNGGRTRGRTSQASGARAKVEEALRERIEATYHRFAEGDRPLNAANVDKLFTVPAGDRATLDPGLGLFSEDGHVHGGNVLVEEIAAHLKSSMKIQGQEVAEHFSRPPFGWQIDLIRYVAAAMFVDGKLTAVDRSGKRFDDPRLPAARQQFGTAAFRALRLEVEEESLTPQESTAARDLLAGLGRTPRDSSEIELRDTARVVCSDFRKRLNVVEKAREVDFPLPPVYDSAPLVLEEIEEATSRVKTVRALLAHADELDEASAALKQLEDFGKQFGFAQYRRSQELLDAAVQAGLAEDPEWGEQVQHAQTELQALIEQRRVLEEWSGAYQTYRLTILDAFRSVYTPLRKALHDGVELARASVMEMPEFGQLSLGNRATIRVQYLTEGKPLGEVPLPQLQDEEQLLIANRAYSIAHMRVALTSLESVVGAARKAVIDLLLEEQRQKGEMEKFATWSATEAFAGKRFTPEDMDEIDKVFDAEKERIKALVRQGKTVQVL